MYDTSKLNDREIQAEELNTALDYLVAANEIIKKHRAINEYFQERLADVTRELRREVIYRFEYIEEDL